MKFSIGDNVAFSRAVVRRLGHDKYTADARGRVVEIDGRVVAVDFTGQAWPIHVRRGAHARR
jgi:hypothetical protein